MTSRIYYLLFCIVLLSSCAKDQLEIDNSLIKSYLEEHHLQAVEHDSGMYYIIRKEGIGTQYPDLSSTISIQYKGYLTDHTVFDEVADNEALTIFMGDMVEGLQEGIPLLNKGAEATFLIPSSLGFNSNALVDIPPNSVLIFDIKLVDFD